MSASSSTVSNAASRVADSAHKAVDAAVGAAAPAIDRIASKAHSTVDKTASAAGVVAGKMDEAGQALDDVGAQFLHSSSSYIRANPLTAVGIATALGFLISRISR